VFGGVGGERSRKAKALLGGEGDSGGALTPAEKKHTCKVRGWKRTEKRQFRGIGEKGGKEFLVFGDTKKSAKENV